MSENRANMPIVLRVWLMGDFSVELNRVDGTWEKVEKNVWEGSYARVLLKRLLSTPDRQASRSTLLDQLFPNASLHLADKYLNNAAWKLHQILGQDILKQLGARGTGGYQLEKQALLWTDWDACEALLKDAERLRSPEERLPLLEKAAQYLGRGHLLEGESGSWCVHLRTRQEVATRYCQMLLAQGYETQHLFWQAREQYERLLDLNPLDEDALCRFLSLLHQHGTRSDIQAVYEQAKAHFEEEGFSLSQATQALADKFLHEPFTSLFVTNLLTSDLPVLHQPAPLWVAQVPSISYNTTSASSSSLPDLDMLMKSRRQVLKEILSTACATLMLSPSALLLPDAGERLTMISTHPSSLDSEALTHLTDITKHYWKLSENASIDILSGIAGHFTTVTQLLKVSHPTPMYERLCSVASETALLLGRTFHEIREYDLALEYFTFSLKVARDVCDTDLWAAGVGRIALLLICWGQPQQVLPLLHEAQRRPLHNQRLRLWLSAIEAEIHAMMGDMDSCIRCLDRAKSVTLPISLADDIYETGFHPSRVAGYEGSCFLRLRQPEQALPVLNEAFALCEPTLMCHQSMLLADRGTVHAQLGDVQTACSLIVEALDITEQTKSLVALQRIYKGKMELDPWKENNEVKSLNERILEVFTSLTKMKEQ